MKAYHISPLDSFFAPCGELRFINPDGMIIIIIIGILVMH